MVRRPVVSRAEAISVVKREKVGWLKAGAKASSKGVASAGRIVMGPSLVGNSEKSVQLLMLPPGQPFKSASVELSLTFSPIVNVLLSFLPSSGAKR
jgi:hypothetical protein